MILAGFNSFEIRIILVLWNIFRKLDDLSIWSVSRVCKRWHELVRQEINDDEWRMFICNRWIFFRPAVKIRNHQALYSQLYIINLFLISLFNMNLI